MKEKRKTGSQKRWGSCSAQVAFTCCQMQCVFCPLVAVDKSTLDFYIAHFQHEKKEKI